MSLEKTSTSNQNQEFNINPETGMLISHGHEYLDIPRMREFIQRANKIRESLPEVPSDHTRLWRGNRPGEIGQNPSFTSSLEGIALPFLGSYGGSLSYVDVPNIELNKFLQTSAVAKDSEFILSAELACRAVEIKEEENTSKE